MADTPELKDLIAIVEALREEVRSLRSEVAGLKVKEKLKSDPLGLLAKRLKTPPPPPPSETPPPIPLPYPEMPRKAACPACHASCEADSDYCDQCAAPLSTSAQRKVQEERLKADGLPKISTEQFIGERLLHYVGVGLLAVGVAFFLVWRAAHTGPGERVFMASCVGAVLVALGSWLRARPPYDKIANGVIGGGWSVLYLTAYAAYYFEATKVVTDPMTELSLLGGAAAGMIVHALLLESKAFRLYSFGLTYLVLMMCGAEVASFEMFVVLLGASALIAMETGHADILIVSALGYYANYLPVFFRVVFASPGAPRSLPAPGVSGAGGAPGERPPPLGTGSGLEAFLGSFGWLAMGYAILALLPLVPRARERLLGAAEERNLDAALSLNLAAFAVMAAVLTASYFGQMTPRKALALSCLVTWPGIAYMIFLPRKLSVGSLAPVLGLLILAWGIAEMPAPLWKMLAWLGAASAWVWMGLIFDHTAWRVSGFLMALLTFLFYFNVARISEDHRRSASMAMFLFSAVSYLSSRYYRIWLKGRLGDWEKPAMEYWLYVGTAALVIGLWGVLDPAPLAVALIALAVVGEFAAVYFGRVHLWGQAAALGVGVGVYTFFIDYGPNLPIAGILSPRLLTALCVVAGQAYLYYADPTPSEFTKAWAPWSRRRHRVMLTWVMAAVAVFAVYREFDPRLRLPIWAATATLLYWLGRSREEDHLKTQSVLLALATGFEGYYSYFLTPQGLLAAPSAAERTMYWGSALLLMGNLFITKGKDHSPTPTDHQASWAFPALGLGMMAFYLGHELDSYYLTMALSAEGIVFLSAGMLLALRELRYPSLLLLGFCVFKAVVYDTSGLPLPQRVATFMGLGIILLGASMMYVRAGKDQRS